jgi:hypothetical protein
MVYCMTETNLWPPKPEMWECPGYKGSAAALPHYSSAVWPAVVRRTSAVGHVGLAFMTMPMRYTLARCMLMRCIPMNYMSLRCMPMRHARGMHAYEAHAYEMHAREVHAHEIYACEVHAHEMHAYEIHTYKRYPLHE